MTPSCESTLDHPLRWFEFLLYHGGINNEFIKFEDDARMLDSSHVNLEYSYTFHEQNEFGDWRHKKVNFKETLAFPIKLSIDCTDQKTIKGCKNNP